MQYALLPSLLLQHKPDGLTKRANDMNCGFYVKREGLCQACIMGVASPPATMTSIVPGLNKRCAPEATLEAPDRQICRKKSPRPQAKGSCSNNRS